jgi:hypothetical protein
MSACRAGTDPGVASAGGAKAGASGKASADSQEQQRLYIQCMRDHGINISDPDPNGGGVQIQPSGNAADPDKVKAAGEACKHLAPNGGAPPTVNPAQVDQARQFARCMREHGIDMSDPDPVTGAIPAPTGGSAIKPDDPRFKTAMKACRDKVPGQASGVPK